MKRFVINGFFLDPKYRNYGMRNYAVRMLKMVLRSEIAMDVVLVVPRGADDLDSVGISSEVEVVYVPNPLGLRYPIMRELFENILIAAVAFVKWRKRVYLNFLPSPFVFKPKRVLNALHDCLPYLESGYFDRFGIVQKRAGFIDRFFWQMVARSLKKSDWVLTVSDQVRDEISDRWNMKGEVLVVPNWIEASERVVSTGSDTILELPESYILYSGGHHFRKDFRSLLRAFAAIADRFPNLCLLTTGIENAPLTEALDECVGDADCRSRIRFLGAVDSSEFPEFYRRAAVLVYPSTYEGFGLPVLESMAYGAPCVASDLECIREFNKNGNSLFEVGDTEDLERKVIECIEDPEAFRSPYPERLEDAEIGRLVDRMLERVSSDVEGKVQLTSFNGAS